MSPSPRRGPAHPRARALASLWLCGSIAAVAAGCAERQPGPADTLSSFAAAVEKKDAAGAYALMSADYRKRVSLAELRAEVERGGPDVEAIARRLRAGAPRAPLRIEVEVGDDADVAAGLGDRVVLVLEEGVWRVDGPPFDLWSQRTPRAALRTFLRAIERRRYDIAVRLVPSRYRAGVTADKLRDYWEGGGGDGARRDENQKLLQRLRASIKAPIVEVGDEARMPYGDNAEVVFVREDGLWKIEDPD